MKRQTAILFFSRDAQSEALNKHFMGVGEHEKNIQIAQLLINDTLLHLQDSGLDIVQINQHQQRGATFGERLKNAFQDVFSLGYEYVIAVGNDTPELRFVEWNSVLTKLKTQIVLGPTDQGGLYLIGLSKGVYKKIPFETFDWQTTLIVDEWLNYCFDRGISVTNLAYAHEINQKEDVQWFLNTSNLRWSFIRALLEIVKTDHRLVVLVTLLLPHDFFKSIVQRGPPSWTTLCLLHSVLKSFCNLNSYLKVKTDQRLDYQFVLESNAKRGPPN